jgi:hypothetical protein
LSLSAANQEPDQDSSGSSDTAFGPCRSSRLLKKSAFPEATFMIL